MSVVFGSAVKIRKNHKPSCLYAIQIMPVKGDSQLLLNQIKLDKVIMYTFNRTAKIFLYLRAVRKTLGREFYIGWMNVQRG